MDLPTHAMNDQVTAGAPKRLPRPLDLILFCLPLGLLGLLCATYPFPSVLASRTCSIAELNKAQRSNVRVAARSIDGLVLQPGEEFSFNRAVGPRTEGRGYRDAPSYLGPDSPSTTGGGICVLSSAVYQAALAAGLRITKRTAHTRTIRSIPAGLDSTVWYGQADLQFQNSLPVPIRLATQWSAGSVKVSVVGRTPHGFNPATLSTVVVERLPDSVVVETIRQSSHGKELISRDSYRISGH